MISKKVGIAPQNDNYAKLATYIADAGPRGEKNFMYWSAGCLGDDDYHNGINEVQDVQALNRRTKQCKTYHLVISFRPEDETTLTPELFMTIERRFAAAFGEVARQHQTALVPFLLEGVANGPDAASLFQPDRIHPNAQAHPMMLGNVWPALRKLLR